MNRLHMRNLINSAAVLAVSMFSLFFVQPDILFIFAFLCALILCCLNLSAYDSVLFLGACICFCAAALPLHPFLFFFPAASYCVFRRSRSLHLMIVVPLLFIAGVIVWKPPLLLFCLDLLGLLTAALLAREDADREALERKLILTQDDSTERDILLTEKNRSLLEKQDYEIYTATLQERNRIAREIHDNVGHLLSRSILLTGAARTVNHDRELEQTLESLDETLNLAMNSIRTSVHDLKDESVNLQDALRALIDDFTFCPITCCYDAGRFIPKDVKYSFISIAKEALSNIMRHSNATDVTLSVREHPGLYQFRIEDNGTDAHIGEGGMGLANMKERVAKLNGNIHFFTENGFKIIITVPKETKT